MLIQVVEPGVVDLVKGLSQPSSSVPKPSDALLFFLSRTADDGRRS